MRLIDADALLLRIDCHGTNKFGMLDEDIREYISKQPTIDPEIVQPQWIPVTERLPKTSKQYLVTVDELRWPKNTYDSVDSPTERLFVTSMYFDCTNKLWHDSDIFWINALIDPEDVLDGYVAVAWLPLPEPYTAKVEDDDNARRVKPLEFDRFKNDTLKDAQPTTPAHWEKADIPLPYQVRTVPTPSRTVAHREMYVCSACGEYSEQNTRYCPHCGARMDRKDGNG